MQHHKRSPQRHETVQKSSPPPSNATPALQPLHLRVRRCSQQRPAELGAEPPAVHPSRRAGSRREKLAMPSPLGTGGSASAAPGGRAADERARARWLAPVFTPTAPQVAARRECSGPRKVQLCNCLPPLRGVCVCVCRNPAPTPFCSTISPLQSDQGLSAVRRQRYI